LESFEIQNKNNFDVTEICHSWIKNELLTDKKSYVNVFLCII
jgi:hypothetical protein